MCRLKSVPSALLVVSLSLLLLLVPGPAEAEWRRAITDRFILYSQGSEADLRETAEQLHQFDRLIRAPFGLSQSPPGQPLIVILTNGRQGMEEIWPGVPRNAGGYYSSSEHEIYAALPRRGDRSVLLHEYVHHVMLQNFPVATPAWFTEGLAVYYMTASIDARETRVGYRNDARIAALNRFAWIPFEVLLTRRALSANREQMAAFYAQAWLLTHYLLSDPIRLRQLEQYLAAVANGLPPLEAVEPAFGMTPAQLEAEVRRYQLGTMPYAVYPTPPADPVIMQIETLAPSAEDLFAYYQRMNYPQRDPDAQEDLARVRALAARWPQDRLAKMTLAKTEFQLGQADAAEAALNSVLADDPGDVEALRWLARLRLRSAEKAEDATDRDSFDRLHRQARAFLGRALRTDPNDYRLYLMLGRSRRVAPGYPDANDLQAWRIAVQLAPQVRAVRAEAAEAFALGGERETASLLLLPLANDPHGGMAAERARQRIGELQPVHPADVAGQNGSDVAMKPDQG